MHHQPRPVVALGDRDHDEVGRLIGVRVLRVVPVGELRELKQRHVTSSRAEATLIPLPHRADIVGRTRSSSDKPPAL
jgi:hypothetical protein